jgi:hypothetical protein
MNRRDLLKALGALSFAGALGGCDKDDHKPEQEKGTKETKAHSLQILLEGPFAVVLQKQTQRLTAFVPLADPARKDLAHEFYFNNPNQGRKPDEKSKGYQFELNEEGLHAYQPSELYINTDFKDFKTDTESWRLPPSLVALNLPFPRSINFSGRPLTATFKNPPAPPRTGQMPTNYIFEYRVEDASKVQLKCIDSDIPCEPSPHCPPGVMRYYFGVGQSPAPRDEMVRKQHAVDFFNFMLTQVLPPELVKRYELSKIEDSDYPMPGMGSDGNGRTYPTSMERGQDHAPLLTPAILRGGPQAPSPRLLPVASLVDCQSGGILVSTTKPNG